MNTKELFIAYLEENNINYEEVKDMILFEFKNHFLVANGFWKKGFRIGIPYALTEDDKPTNSDKELVRLYLQGQGENGGVTFMDSVELNPDGTFNPDEFIKVSNDLSNKNVNIDELRQTSVELISAFCEAFIGIGKFALSTSAALLRGVVDAIDPADNKAINEFGE